MAQVGKEAAPPYGTVRRFCRNESVIKIIIAHKEAVTNE